MADPNTDVIDPDLIPQLQPAWERGYNAYMYGIVENKEIDAVDRVLYDAGVRSARDDEALDQYHQTLDAMEDFRR